MIAREKIFLSITIISLLGLIFSIAVNLSLSGKSNETNKALELKFEAVSRDKTALEERLSDAMLKLEVQEEINTNLEAAVAQERKNNLSLQKEIEDLSLRNKSLQEELTRLQESLGLIGQKEEKSTESN